MFVDLDYLEQLEGWFEKYEQEDLKFEDLEHKYNECKQVSALVFLTTKLKDKKERFFLHGEHDVIYIGSDWDVYEKFTEEDVKIAVAHGIIMHEDGGFQMYASM
jgi:hypothetical protein